jgi:hypothetical protein
LQENEEIDYVCNERLLDVYSLLLLLELSDQVEGLEWTELVAFIV